MLSNNALYRIKTAVLVLFSMAAVLFYYYQDPAVYRFGLPCFVHYTTGWLCWGCGGQRAFHQVLHGNFEAAFHFNALVFIVLPLAVIVLLSELTRNSTIYSALKKSEVRFLAAGITLAFTVFRNVF